LIFSKQNLWFPAPHRTTPPGIDTRFADVEHPGGRGCGRGRKRITDFAFFKKRKKISWFQKIFFKN
jgi:hypothetical protein